MYIYMYMYIYIHTFIPKFTKVGIGHSQNGLDGG